MDTRDLENMPTLCNGKATGKQCKHYLHMIHGGGLKYPGRHLVRRFCLLVYEPGDENGLGASGEAMAKVCSAYEACDARPFNEDLEKITRNGEEVRAPPSYTPPQNINGSDAERKQVVADIQTDAKNAESAAVDFVKTSLPAGTQLLKRQRVSPAKWVFLCTDGTKITVTNGVVTNTFQEQKP